MSEDYSKLRDMQRTIFCGCMIGPNDPDPNCDECFGTGLAGDAKARLFGASPDLLEALGTFIAASHEPDPESKSPRHALLTKAWSKARAAIAKAEGRP